jgi:hypothetical protein
MKVSPSYAASSGMNLLRLFVNILTAIKLWLLPQERPLTSGASTGG